MDGPALAREYAAVIVQGMGDGGIGAFQEDVINIVKEGSGSKYDPVVVRTFLEIMGVAGEEEPSEEVKASAEQAAP